MRSLLALTILVAACADPADPAELPAAGEHELCAHASQLLDLSRWKVQLPVGTPVVELEQPMLATAEATPWFHAAAACDAVVFRAPTSGTTTSGSEYPRAELREMTAAGAKASWSTSSGRHSLHVDAAITAVPRGRPYVIVAQVHDGVDDVITIRMDLPRLYVRTHRGESVTLDPDYRLGKRFTIDLVAEGGELRVSLNGVPTYATPRAVDTAYFKAGVYTQSNCAVEESRGEACGDDNYGELTMYDVVVRHD